MALGYQILLEQRQSRPVPFHCFGAPSGCHLLLQVGLDGSLKGLREGRTHKEREQGALDWRLFYQIKRRKYQFLHYQFRKI